MAGTTTRTRPPRPPPDAPPLLPTPTPTQLIARALHLAQSPTPRPYPDAQAALATALAASASPAAFVADLQPLLLRAARVWERAPAVEAVFANVTAFAAANAGGPPAAGGADRGDDSGATTADEDGEEDDGGSAPVEDSVASCLLLAVAAWTAAADRAVRFRGAQAAGAILGALDDVVVFDGEVYEKLTDTLVDAASDVVVRVRAAAAVALCRLQVVDHGVGMDREEGNADGDDSAPVECPVHTLLAELATGDTSPVVRAAAVSSVTAVGVGAVALRTALRDGCPGVRRAAVAAVAAVNPVVLGGDGRASALVTFSADPDAGVRSVGWSRVVVGAWFRGVCDGEPISFAEMLLRDDIPSPPADGEGEGGGMAAPGAIARSDGAGWDDDAVTPPPTPARSRLVLATLTCLFQDPAAAPELAVDINDLAEADALVLRAAVAVRGAAALTPLIRDAGVLADVLIYYAGLPRVLTQLLPLVGVVGRGGREALRSVLLESILGGEGVDGRVVGPAVEAMRELEGAGRGDEAVLEYTLAEVLPAAAAAATAVGGTTGGEGGDDDGADGADAAATALCRRRASWARLRALHIAEAVLGGAPPGLLFPTAKPLPLLPLTPLTVASDVAANGGVPFSRDAVTGGLAPVSPPRRPAADADGPTAAVVRLLVRLAVASVGGAAAPASTFSPADEAAGADSASAVRAAALRVLGQAALADASGRTATEAAPLLVTAARYEGGGVAADATRSLCDLLVKFGDLARGGGGDVLLGASLAAGCKGEAVTPAGAARNTDTDDDDRSNDGCSSGSDSDGGGVATRRGRRRPSRRTACRRPASAAADAPTLDDLATAAVAAAAAGAPPGSSTAAALSLVLAAATSAGVARRAVGGEAAAKLLLTRRIPASAAAPVLAWLAVSPHVVGPSPRGNGGAAATATATAADDGQWHPDAADADPAARLRSVMGVLFALYVRRGGAAAAAVEAAAVQVATAVAASAATPADGSRRSGGGGGGWGIDTPSAIATILALCALLQRADAAAADRGDGAAGGGGPVARVATAVVTAAAAGLGGVAGVRLLCRLAGGLRPAVAGAPAAALRAAVATAVEEVAEGGGGARAAGSLRRLLAHCEGGEGGSAVD